MVWCVPERVMTQLVCLLIPTNSSQTVHVWTTEVPTMGISKAVWKVGYLHIVSCGVCTASVHKHKLRVRYQSKCKCKESHCYLGNWGDLQLSCKDCIASPDGGICHEIWYVYKTRMEEGDNSKNCGSSLLESGWVAA